jgi:Zn-dependent alcohol dehydrogenase
MKAAVCRAFGEPLQVEEIEIAGPAAGEVQVKVRACAICHSDILFMDGAWGGELPAVYGHEAAGVVEAVGPGVTGLAPGDHVVVTLIRSCGGCHYCERAMETQCETRFPLDEQSPLRDATGASLVHGLRTGGFAEQVLVEASQVCAIPPGIPFDAASLLACGALTGFCAVTNTANMPAGSTAAVIGCGGVGLNTIQGARYVGATKIIALDLVDAKLAAAKQFGATDAFNSGGDARDRVLALTGGRGVDYAFITVGAAKAIDLGLTLLAAGGSAVIVGMPPSGINSEIDPGTLASRGQSLLGSKMGSARVAVDIPHLVGLYQRGDLKLDELISGRYPLTEINQAVASVKSGTALRNVIIFD